MQNDALILDPSNTVDSKTTSINTVIHPRLHPHRQEPSISTFTLSTLPLVTATRERGQSYLLTVLSWISHNEQPILGPLSLSLSSSSPTPATEHTFLDNSASNASTPPPSHGKRISYSFMFSFVSGSSISHPDLFSSPPTHAHLYV